MSSAFLLTLLILTLCLYLLNAKIWVNYFDYLILKQFRLSDKKMEFYRFLTRHFLSLGFLHGWHILSLLLLFAVCMRLRGHSWKSSVLRHGSGDKCFIWSEVYNQLFLSVEWKKETEKKHTIFADLIVFSYSVEVSTVHLYWHQRRDQMQRKANARAHVGLFLYRVLMVSELSLSVLPKVCVGLGKSPGVAA